MILSYVYKQEETDIAGPEASQELYKKNCSEKFQRIHRMPVPLFGGAVSPQYLTHNLKKKSLAQVCLCNFTKLSECFCRTSTSDCFGRHIWQLQKNVSSTVLILSKRKQVHITSIR